jgi:excisionase family DNA binding protein
MLTPHEVAEILGIHQKTVHLWLRTGKLEGVKISYRSWRIPQSALEAFINKNRNVSPIEKERPTAPVTPEKNGLQTQNPGAAGQPIPGRATMKFYIREIMGEESDTKDHHRKD